jgi:hypothetical protein
LQEGIATTSLSARTSTVDKRGTVHRVRGQKAWVAIHIAEFVLVLVALAGLQVL